MFDRWITRNDTAEPLCPAVPFRYLACCIDLAGRRRSRRGGGRRDGALDQVNRLGDAQLVDRAHGVADQAAAAAQSAAPAEPGGRTEARQRGVGQGRVGQAGTQRRVRRDGDLTTGDVSPAAGSVSAGFTPVAPVPAAE